MAAYKAESVFSNTKADNKTTNRSQIKNKRPVFKCAYLNLRSFTIISVPPVVAPHLKIIPRDIDAHAEPPIVANNGSVVIGGYNAVIFVITEQIKVA